MDAIAAYQPQCNVKSVPRQNNESPVEKIGKRTLKRSSSQEPPKKKIKVSFECVEISLEMPEEWENEQTDVTIVLDGWKVIKTHREILRECLYFEAMFNQSHTWSESQVNQPIYIRDWQPEIVAKVIQHLYLYDIELTPGNIGQIALLADMWGINTLMEECQAYVRNCSDLECTLKLWELGISFLDDEIFNLLTVNAESLRFSKEFLMLKEQHIFRLLKSPLMNVRSEYEIFKLLIFWAKANCSENAALREFLLSKTVCGERLIDSIQYQDIHPIHLFDNIAKHQLFSQNELRPFAKVAKGRLQKSREWSRNNCNQYEVQFCNRQHQESLYYPQKWDKYNQDWDRLKYGNYRMRHYWRIQNVDQEVENRIKIRRSWKFEYNPDKVLYKYTWYCLAYKISDVGMLQFFMGSDDLLYEINKDDSKNKAHRIVSATLTLINHFDRRRHIIKKVSAEISNGSSTSNLKDSPFAFAIGENIVSVQDLLDKRKGWVVDGAMILSAIVDIEEL